MATLFAILEPIQIIREPCVICCEEDSDRNAWIQLENEKQPLHLPCIVEIVKRSREPKHPFTNLPLTANNLIWIEEQARIHRIFCPTTRFRQLIWRSDERLQKLEELSTWMDTHDITRNLQKLRKDLQDYIFYIAEFCDKPRLNWKDLCAKIDLHITSIEQETWPRLRLNSLLHDLFEQNILFQL